MSSGSEDERNGDDNLTPNGGADQDLNDEMDHLFDDDVDDAAEAKAQRRTLDDEELDSGDDEGRYDRADVQEDEPVPDQTVDLNVQENSLGRHPVPESSDGESYLLKIPKFASIDPVAFTLQNFQPPTTDHHETTASANFSPYKVAQTTIRYRHSPSNPSELQSNARILRWSDGSLTLQLASDPTVQYEIQARAAAPPQKNPKKPTPVARVGMKHKNWSEKQETYTYLAAASQEAYLVRTASKITASLQVNTVGDDQDEALERLRGGMQAARGPNHGMVNLSTNVQDPEHMRRQAEQAEKDMLKAQRRLEAQQDRENLRGGRGGRGGPRASGLTVGGLEDELGGGERRRGGGAKKAARRRAANNDEYSDEEEQYGAGYRGNQDEYDEEDDFIAGSEDEDMDAEGEDDDDDIDALLAKREREQKAARGETPKRDRDVDEEDEDEGRGDSPVSRHKRRRVVEDDDDDE